MKDYLELWVKFAVGVGALIWAILLPFILLILEILPYGIMCLIMNIRLKDEYRYFYFIPTFIKDITKPLRNKKKSVDNN